MTAPPSSMESRLSTLEAGRINDTSQDYSESVVADPLNTGRPCVTVIPEVVVDETGLREYL